MFYHETLSDPVLKLAERAEEQSAAMLALQKELDNESPHAQEREARWRFIIELLLKSKHRGTLFLSSLCKFENRIRQGLVIKHTLRNLSSPISNYLTR